MVQKGIVRDRIVGTDHHAELCVQVVDCDCNVEGVKQSRVRGILEDACGGLDRELGVSTLVDDERIVALGATTSLVVAHIGTFGNRYEGDLFLIIITIALAIIITRLVLLWLVALVFFVIIIIIIIVVVVVERTNDIYI